MNQRDRIIKHLKAGRKISTLSALTLFGVLRLSERIREIERTGVKINRKRVEVKKECGDTSRIVVYSL